MPAASAFLKDAGKDFAGQNARIGIHLTKRFQRMIASIIRFITGRYSEKDLSNLNRHIAQEPQNADELHALRHTYDAARGTTMSTKKVLNAFARLQTRIENDAPRFSIARHRRAIFRYAAASVLLMALAASALWLFNARQTQQESVRYIVAMAGNKAQKKVVLPDGSCVWLNKNASIKYPEAFAHDVRKVFLTGEGYFEVTKNPHRPFIVVNGDISVKVLGTVFNFNNDAAQRCYRVSLIEGSVEVKNHKSADQILLEPGQRANIDYATGRIKVSQSNVAQDAMWHNELIVFEKATLRSIAAKLEKLYGTRIIVETSLNDSHTYSGAIHRKNNLDAVLQSLQHTLPFHYKKTKSEHNAAQFVLYNEPVR